MGCVPASRSIDAVYLLEGIKSNKDLCDVMVILEDVVKIDLSEVQFRFEI